jgi:flagellar biosynthesis/type III secretory pathway M-ring protein FliF/YscJ
MAEMSPSARLLIGSIAIILAMGLFLVAQYAAGPATTSLQVDPEFEAVAMQRIRDAGYTAEKGESGTLTIPQRDKRRIERLLQENEIPVGKADTSTRLSSGGFKSDVVFRAELRQIRVAKAEQTIRAISGVVEARVLIGEPERRGFGRDRSLPKATATIRVRGGEVDRSLAQSVAVIAASVDADLQLNRVQVIDASTGRTFAFSDDDSGAGGDYLADVRSIARDLKSRVYNLLSMSYPSVRVEANAQVLRAHSESETWELGKPQSAETYERIEEESKPVAERGSRRSGFAFNGGTAGLNTPVGPVGARPVATRAIEERQLQTGFPGSVERTQSSNGHPMQLDLAIVIPEDEFLATFASTDGATFTPEQIQAEKTRQQQVIRALVEPMIDTTALRGGKLGTVEIAILPSAIGPEYAAGLGGTSAPMQFVFGDGGQTLKSVGLVVLSLLSLAVMFLMVRRSTGPTSAGMPTAAELGGAPSPLSADGVEVLGDVDESPPALVGVELDDEALRRRQMLDQLNKLVQEEPAEVASLIRRWMRSEA